VKGHVGAEILRCCVERGWLARLRGGRALRLTPAGSAGLAQTFGVELGEDAGAPPGPWRLRA
jgi:hypothetical protein